MARPASPAPRFPRLLLLVGGSICILAGAGGLAAGVLLPDRIRAMLPPVVADASAVGGAAVALGTMVLVAGAGQIGIGIWLPRVRWLSAAAALALAGLGALVLASAVAVLTEVAAGAPGWLIAPGTGLVGLAILYGAAAWMTSSRTGEPGPEGG